MATTKNAETLMQLTQELHAADCMPDAVRDHCWDELQRIAVKKYKNAIEATSSRLGGFGWSSAHVKDHMNRFLKERMERRAQIFRK